MTNVLCNLRLTQSDLCFILDFSSAKYIITPVSHHTDSQDHNGSIIREPQLPTYEWNGGIRVCYDRPGLDPLMDFTLLLPRFAKLFALTTGHWRTPGTHQRRDKRVTLPGGPDPDLDRGLHEMSTQIQSSSEGQFTVILILRGITYALLTLTMGI
ncbi:unnamed protein product [Nesidiocoris tenuis]|uniref:Uncharacterized protein n=1 Tax=Nesidiocoris tenuis TaxID=355587 RepID=A0A6H5GZS6_9HEMI|nr:unnamed protein product [Nesidiocoris tenuis]